MNQNLLNQFRRIAFAEGVSFILLVFVAMPLKYWAGMPEAVKFTGWAHGILFVLYGIFLIRVKDQYNWTLTKQAAAVAAALLPFGTFIMEKRTSYYAETVEVK